MNQELLVRLSPCVRAIACVCVSLSKSASFREIGVLILTCITVSVCARGVCSRHAWVECCKRLKLRWKSRPGKNSFSPHCCMSGLRFTSDSLCYYFFLSPGKCGGYLLTSIYELVQSDPPCWVMSRPPRRRVCASLFTTPILQRFVSSFS